MLFNLFLLFRVRACEYVGGQSTQDKLAHEHVSTQDTLACQHTSLQDTLARNYVRQTIQQTPLLDISYLFCYNFHVFASDLEAFWNKFNHAFSKFLSKSEKIQVQLIDKILSVDFLCIKNPGQNWIKQENFNISFAQDLPKL